MIEIKGLWSSNHLSQMIQVGVGGRLVWVFRVWFETETLVNLTELKNNEL